MVLFENQIHDAGAMALADMLKTNTALKFLDLRENKIGTKGVAAFVNALMVKNSTMEVLEVDIAEFGKSTRLTERANSAPYWSDDDLSVNDDTRKTYEEWVSSVNNYLANSAGLASDITEERELSMLAHNLLYLIKANHADADVACNNLGTLVDRTNASSECICFSDTYFDEVNMTNNIWQQGSDIGIPTSALDQRLRDSGDFDSSGSGSGSDRGIEVDSLEESLEVIMRLAHLSPTDLSPADLLRLQKYVEGSEVDPLEEFVHHGSAYGKEVMLNSSQYKISGPRCQYNHVTTCNGQGWLQDDSSCKCPKHVGDDCSGVTKSRRRWEYFFGGFCIVFFFFYSIKYNLVYFRLKKPLLDQIRTFGQEHAFRVRTIAGDEYTLTDWAMCRDLRELLAEQHPSLGDWETFVLQDVNTHKIIDPKISSKDRIRMMMISNSVSDLSSAFEDANLCFDPFCGWWDGNDQETCHMTWGRSYLQFLVWCGIKCNQATRCSCGNTLPATCCEDAPIVEWNLERGIRLSGGLFFCQNMISFVSTPLRIMENGSESSGVRGWPRRCCTDSHQVFTSATTRRGTASSCPSGHGLTQFSTPNSGFDCDLCDAQMPEGATLYGCRQCDYDVCALCRRSAAASISTGAISEETPGASKEWGKYELVLTYDAETAVSMNGNVVHNHAFIKTLVGTEGNAIEI